MACCPSFRMCTASLIHLVKRSGSLSITVAWDQLMTWFSWVAWSVRAYLLCSVKLDARWRLVLDSTSVVEVPVIWLRTSFQFNRCRSCHNWHKELCTYILLRLPYPVCLLGVPVHPLGFCMVSMSYGSYDQSAVSSVSLGRETTAHVHGFTAPLKII